MLIIISPAKKLNINPSIPNTDFSLPDYLDKSQYLVNLLKQKSPYNLSTLMGISDKLAVLNAGRYETWQYSHDQLNAKQAIYTFNGDVYRSLAVSSLSGEEVEYLQKHLRILSGLYGVLKPLDLIQPYRLEMGVPLENAEGHSLYDFWKRTITSNLNNLLEMMDEKVLVNLASTEYFSVIDTALFKGKIITPVFQQQHNGQFKTIGILAKRARGVMTRWIAQKGMILAEEIKTFDEESYQYNKELSSQTKWIFRQNHFTI